MLQARAMSSTTYPVVFLMTDTTDHITGKTGLTPTVTLSKNGGAFAAAAGAVTEISNGWYALAGNATDRNTLGSLVVHAAAAGADPADILLLIVTNDPFAAGFGTLGGSSTLTYTLTNADTGAPEADATVELYATAGRTDILASQITNAFGVATFTGLVPGTYYLTVLKTGYEPSYDSEVVA